MLRPSVVVLSLVFAAAACGGTSPTSTDAPGQTDGGPVATPAGTPSDGGPEPTPGTSLTACELVAPADIEAALGLEGGTVDDGVLQQQGNVLDPAVNECRYTGDWGGLVVNVTPTDGINVFDALVKSFGDSAEALELGDGALWFEDNDRGYFLEGSVMVRLQFTHITAGVASFRDFTIALGEAAVSKL